MLTSSSYIIQEEIRARNVNACASLLRRLIREAPSPTKWLHVNQNTVATAISLSKNALTDPHFHIPEPANPASLSVFANVAAAIGDWKSALVFVDPARPPPVSFSHKKETRRGTVGSAFYCHPSALFLSKLMSRENWKFIADWCDKRNLPFSVPTAVARIGMVGGSWDVALEIATAYEKLHNERYSTGILVPFLSQGGQWRLAMQVFGNSLAEGSLLDHSLIEKMISCTANGAVEEGQRSQRQERDRLTKNTGWESNFESRWQSCLSMVSAFDRCGAFAELDGKNKSVSQMYMQVMDICPSWMHCLELINVMHRAHAAVSERLILSAMSTCDRQGQWQAATALFDYARAHQMFVSPINKEAQGQVKMKENSEEKFATLTNTRDKSVTTSISKSFGTKSNNGRGQPTYLPEATKDMLIHHFRMSAQWEKALDALEWMEKAGQSSRHAGMLNTIVICEQSGRWEMALRAGAAIFEEDKMNGGKIVKDASGEKKTMDTKKRMILSNDLLPISNYNALASQYQASLETKPSALPIPEDDIPEEVYISLLRACVAGKKWQPALRVFDALVHDVRITAPQPMTSSLVLQVCHAAHQWDAALTTLTQMMNAQPAVMVPPVGMRLVVKTCVDAGRWVEALVALDLMDKAALPRNDCDLMRTGLWAAALTGEWKAGLGHYKSIPATLKRKKDRDLLELSMRYANPVGRFIIKKHLDK